MTPKYRKKIVLLMLVLVTLLAVVQTVQACECPESNGTTLGKLESARFVVVTRIISIHQQPGIRTVSNRAEVTGEAITTITMIVEKVYKGNLKVGDEMIFGQGKTDCVMEFQEEEVGTKFLLYLHPKEKKPKLWFADSCGRSIPLPNYPTRYVADAAQDLSYLDKMNEVRGKTRISGTLISYQWSIAQGGADFKKVAGAKVRIVGNGKSYEAVTNQEGVYEIYDLPVGTYAIRPEVGQGWKIDERSAFGGGSSGRHEDDGSSQVSLKAGRHAYADFIVKVNNHLSGRVLDGSGRPLQSVCLRLVPTQPNISAYFKREDCTDADGSFEIEEIPFASYVVVINDDDKISSREPFRRFYYPDAVDREKAGVITIVAGDTKYPLDIHIPEVKEIVSVTGKVVSANDKPVVFAQVGFISDQMDPTIDGSAYATTDQQGNFSLNVLKGLSGVISAAVMLDPKEFKNCTEMLRIRGEISLNRRTEAVRLQADRRINGVELRLPFPSCQGEKIQSQIRVD